MTTDPYSKLQDRYSERVRQHNKEKNYGGPNGKTGTLVLDPRDPMQAARALVAARFMNDDHRLLHRHRGTFWRFQNNHYVLADQEMVRAEVWRFLEQAERLGSNDKPGPFKPNRARVSDVLDALNSACALDSLIDPPAWLNGADCKLPPAVEMFPVANGLLHLPSSGLYPPTPDYFGLSASDVAFDPNAPDPVHWFAFLTDLFGKDEQAITALQDWFGYALAPDTSQHKILYQKWRLWCDNVGRKPGTKQIFGRDLRAALPSLRMTHTRDGNTRERNYEGIGLRERS